MLALFDTLLIMLMRLSRLDRVVLRNLDDLMNPFRDDPRHTISLMAYRRSLMRGSKQRMQSKELNVRMGGKPLTPKRSHMT